MGIDVIDDLDAVSQRDYASYISYRRAGSGGEFFMFVYQDLELGIFQPPRAGVRRPGAVRAQDAGGNAPIGVRDPEALLQRRRASRRRRWPRPAVDAAFMTAASPGWCRWSFGTNTIRTKRPIPYAIAEPKRDEYETIVNAGITLEIDCPGSGHGTAYPACGPEPALVAQEGGAACRVPQPCALQYFPGQVRTHLCWGNYEGPAPLRRGAGRRDRHRVQGKPGAISLEAANPRHAHEWALFETVKLPEGKVLIPGVIESKSNFIEHPELVAQRIGRYANLVGRET